MPRRFPNPVITPSASDETCAVRARVVPAAQRDKGNLVPKPRGGTTTVLHRKCHRSLHALWSEAESTISMRKTGSLPNVRPLMLIAASFIIRATRFVAVVPRLSFRLGDQCVLYPRVSLSAPPLRVQYLANRPRLLPKVDGAVP